MSAARVEQGMLVRWQLLVMMVAPMMMMPPRPGVEANVWAVVPAIPMRWAVPMAAMPVAPVPHLLNVGALAGYRLEVSCYAGRRRSLSRYRHDSEHKCRDERTCPFHSRSSCCVVAQKPCVGKCCRREFSLPGMVDVETRGLRESSRHVPAAASAPVPSHSPWRAAAYGAQWEPLPRATAPQGQRLAQGRYRRTETCGLVTLGPRTHQAATKDDRREMAA
jgi:hypothetical protein